MNQGHMDYIAISESTHFGLSKITYFSQQFFASLGIVRQNIEKLGSDPSLGSVRAQTLASFFK